MTSANQDQVTFWRTLAGELEGGRPLLECLSRARAALAGSGFEGVAERLAADVADGATLSAAMLVLEGTFSRCTRAMIGAGEARGALDAVAGLVAEGLREATLPPPDAATPDGGAERWWRALALLLSSGVPLLEALDLLAREVAGPGLAGATRAIGQAILDGMDFGSALSLHPDAFPEDVRAAASIAERRGDLDRQGRVIANALAAGRLRCLAPEAAGVDAGQAATEDESPAARLLDRIVRRALRERASDIHLDSMDKGGLGIRLRVDGALRETEVPPPGLGPAIVSRAKRMAGMDVAERRLPQDGRVLFDLDGKRYDLRISVVPTVLGERVVFRILDREAACFDLERIALLPDDLAAVRKLTGLPNGLVICNGPTGSGKTTLLYAMLMETDRGKSCAVSVEDPVEYHLPGVAQIQVDPRVGLTFARALRSVMRQDPDVVMIGEIRDMETLSGAVECALTGHLVLTTLHAETSPGALRRLLDIGLTPFLVNSALAGVITQRLVRVLCTECRRKEEPPSHPSVTAFLEKRPATVFYGPRGCEACRGTGYRGRAAIHEILVPDGGVRRVVAAGGDVTAIRDAALRAGMRSLLWCGIEKAALGVTSLEELFRVLPRGADEPGGPPA